MIDKYFKMIWDNRANKPGNWLNFDIYKVSFYWFWHFTCTPHKSNKTWFHCYIHTPIFHYQQNNNSKSVALCFGKWQIGFTYHW